MKLIKLLTFFITALFLSFSAYAGSTDLGDNWCSDVKIHFFAGGAEGDGFAGIVQAGAENAIRDTGADAQILYSDWDLTTMIQQLKESIEAGVDGIGMMGHPGEEAIMPLAEDAHKAGILMMYQNVDVPEVRAKYGGGYVGADLSTQGEQLAYEAIRRFKLKARDKAIVIVSPGEKAQREIRTRIVFENYGMEVVVLNGSPAHEADPNLAIGLISTALVANRDTKILVHFSAQMLGNAETFAQASGKEPNELLQIGFGINPQVISGFAKGYVHLTSEQQPFLQGYLPILALCQMKVLGTGAHNQDIGNGFIHTENYKSYIDLVKKSLR